MIDLILSLDYEIFGNGAGDVMRDIIEPTNRLLDIFDSQGAKLTIMFEAAEYWAFKQMEDKLDLGYSPAKAMEEQAQDAIKRGHDVQLHLHPQWIGAELENCLWCVRMNQWCIADLPHGLGDHEDEYSIMGALSKGKRTLESMLCPVKPAYECIAFRAGGFHIQPSSLVISAMKAVGLLIDSSVVQGLYVQSPQWRCDFRAAVSSYGYWWTTADDVCRSGPEGEQILELPVYSRMQPYITNFRWLQFRKVLRCQKLQSSHSGVIHGNTEKLTEALSKLTSIQPVTVDFCVLSARSMVRAVEKIMATNGYSDNETDKTVPVVLIGHSKDFWNDKHLNSVLSTMRSWSKSKGGIRFSTFSNVAETVTRTSEKHALVNKKRFINSETEDVSVKPIEIKDSTRI